jgi:hypothetical protein
MPRLGKNSLRRLNVNQMARIEHQSGEKGAVLPQLVANNLMRPAQGASFYVGTRIGWQCKRFFLPEHMSRGEAMVGDLNERFTEDFKKFGRCFGIGLIKDEIEPRHFF